MKKLLLILALLLIPTAASAQCNGIFPNSTVCGNATGSKNLPRPTSPSAFQGSAGGVDGQIQYNNSGALGSLTNAQVNARVVPIYDTAAAVIAATIPSTYATIYVRGYLAAGDPGGGWRTRSASVPAHTAYIQSADGAYWSPSLANGTMTLEMFGGACGGTGFDNTPAFNRYNSFIQVVGQIRLHFQGCVYYFNTLPNAFTSTPPYIQGTGTNGTVLMRNINGIAGVGFIQLTGASGLVIKDVTIGGNTGTTNGDAIRFDATSSNGSSGSHLDNVTISGYGTDNFDNMITLNGNLKITGAIGTRDHTWSNVILFGSAVLAVNGTSVEGLSWMGGAVYPAGGGGTASLTFTAISAPLASNYINIVIGAGTQIDIDHCTGCNFRAPRWTGDSNNTANADRSGVAGQVVGTSQANWINSSYLAF